MRYLFVILIILYPKIVTSQDNDKLIREKVLESNITDSSFVFGKWDKANGTETHLKYLGQVDTKNGETIKIMTSIWIWGLSQRSTNRILIYNSKNQYLGNYYVYDENDLPIKLENGILIIKRKDKSDNSIETKIDFTKGIPKQIFIKEYGESGDLYNFTSE